MHPVNGPPKEGAWGQISKEVLTLEPLERPDQKTFSFNTEEARGGGVYQSIRETLIDIKGAGVRYYNDLPESLVLSYLRSNSSEGGTESFFKKAQNAGIGFLTLVLFLFVDIVRFPSVAIWAAVRSPESNELCIGSIEKEGDDYKMQITIGSRKERIRGDKTGLEAIQKDYKKFRGNNAYLSLWKMPNDLLYKLKAQGFSTIVGNGVTGPIKEVKDGPYQVDIYIKEKRYLIKGEKYQLESIKEECLQVFKGNYNNLEAGYLISRISSSFNDFEKKDQDYFLSDSLLDLQYKLLTLEKLPKLKPGEWICGPIKKEGVLSVMPIHFGEKKYELKASGALLDFIREEYKRVQASTSQEAGANSFVGTPGLYGLEKGISGSVERLVETIGKPQGIMLGNKANKEGVKGQSEIDADFAGVEFAVREWDITPDSNEWGCTSVKSARGFLFIQIKLEKGTVTVIGGKKNLEKIINKFNEKREGGLFAAKEGGFGVMRKREAVLAILKEEGLDQSNYDIRESF